MPQLGLHTGVTAPSLSMGSAPPLTPITNNTVFDTAIALWFSNNASAIQTYGHIASWDTSAVTDMSEAFRNRSNFNENISGWNVDSVTNMNSMFRSATSFNQDLNDWNTSSVTKMFCTFQNATAFDQDIRDWDTSNVTTMNNMFKQATAFNQNISGWDLSGTPTHVDFDLNSNSNWSASHKPAFV
jgi:surface protein